MQSRIRLVSPAACTNCPGLVAYDPFCKARTTLHPPSNNKGRSSGCFFHLHFRVPQGLRDSRNGHVSSGNRRTAGGVDPKKSVEDLARCMSLNVDRVWVRTPQGEILVPISQVQPGDAVIVRAGGSFQQMDRYWKVNARSTSPPSPANQSLYQNILEAWSMQELYWKKASAFWK